MGFFSKIFKGVKKVFKKIGKGIKSAFKKFGKFMGKIGILGQVAMMFILPGIGAALGGAFTGAAGALATNTVGGALGAVGQAAGKVMQFVGNTVSKAGNVFNNVTKGVTDTLGNFAKTASNKMFGTSFDAASNFFGAGDSAFSRSFGGESRFQNLTKDFSKVTEAINKTVAESGGNIKVGEVPDTYSSIMEKELPLGESAVQSTPTSFEASQASIAQTEIDLSNYFDDINAPRSGGPAPVEDAVGTMSLMSEEAGKKAVEESEGFFSDFVKNSKEVIGGEIDNLKDKGIGAFIGEDPLAETFDKFITPVAQYGAQKIVGAVPEYNQQYVTNAAYVPPMSSFASPQSQYGAPEIMDARAFEQQVAFNPNPYGYTAFQYGNYMSQFGQTA